MRPSIVAMPTKVAEPPSVVYLNDLAVSRLFTTKYMVFERVKGIELQRHSASARCFPTKFSLFILTFSGSVSRCKPLNSNGFCVESSMISAVIILTFILTF